MRQGGGVSAQLPGDREDPTEDSCSGRLRAAIELCQADTASLWLSGIAAEVSVYPEARRVQLAGLKDRLKVWLATRLYPYLRSLEKEDPPVSCLQLEHIGLLTVVRSPGGQSMVHADGILQVTLGQSLVGSVFILSEVRYVTPGCDLQPHTSRCHFPPSFSSSVLPLPPRTPTGITLSPHCSLSQGPNTN